MKSLTGFCLPAVNFTLNTYCKKLAFILLIFLYIISSVQAQSSSPYQFSKNKTLALTLGSIAFSVGGQLTQNTVKPLIEADRLGLDRMNIPAFERSVSYNWRPKVAKASDWVFMGAVLLPGTLLAFKPIRQDIGKPVILGIQTLTIGYGITGFTKALVRRNRPFTFIQNSGDPLLIEKQLERDSRFSFFSGHTSLTAASAFMGAKMYADYYPQSSARPWVWAGAAILPAVVGYMRVRSGKHFISDVIAGYLVGGAVGILVPHLQKAR
ncbi:MAG: phosphatase PAP2 family protein [Bacteroidia bacterium]